MDTFSNRIKLLRTKKGITQEELARVIHVKRATLANWETGRTEPDIENIQKLAVYFNVPADYLLGLSDDPTPYDVDDVDEPTEKDLEELMKKGGLMLDGEPLDEEDRQDILAAMRIVWQTIQKRKRK